MNLFLLSKKVVVNIVVVIGLIIGGVVCELVILI